MDKPLSRRTLLASALAAPVVPRPAGPQDDAAPPADVPTYRGNNARTGAHPGPGPAGDPKTLWYVRLGEVLSSSASIANGVVYISSLTRGTVEGGALHAVDAVTGIELWRRATVPGDGFFTTAAVADDLVVIGSYDGIVLAADAATGVERWRFQAADTFFASPALDAGTVWLADTGGHLYALDAGTGAERWRVEVGDGADRAFATPAVVDEVVYVIEVSRWPGEPPYLHAYDAASGEESWRFSPDTGTALRATTVVAGGLVYVVTLDNFVHAVDAGTGVEQERYDVGSPTRTELAIVDGTLYVGADDGELHAIELGTGEQRWTHRLDPDALPMSAPCVADGVVYVGDTAGTMHALDAGSGNVRWSAELGSLRSGPVVTGGVLYVGTNLGYLQAIGRQEDA